MNEPTLFDSLAPVHTTDGPESREAASRVNAEDQYHRVLLALYNARTALSDDDLGEAVGIKREHAGTRRGVACKRGLVERYGTGVTPRGNSCAVWRLTAAGVEYVQTVLQRRVA